MKEYLEDETIDPLPVESLMRLHPTPLRDRKAIEAGRARFLSELEELFPVEAEAERPFKDRTGQNFWQKIAVIFRSGPLARPAVTAFAIMFIVLVLLFGGVGVTARASQSALPGDPLYTIKTGLEQARLDFAGSLAQQARLYMQFASIRLDEIQKLIRAGRYEDAMKLSGESHTYIDKALAAVDQLSTIEPAQAETLSVEINSKLSAYSVKLGKLMSSIPEQLQSQIQDHQPATGPGIPYPYPYPLNGNDNPYQYPYQGAYPYPTNVEDNQGGMYQNNGSGTGEYPTPTDAASTSEDQGRHNGGDTRLNNQTGIDDNGGAQQNSGGHEDGSNNGGENHDGSGSGGDD